MKTPQNIRSPSHVSSMDDVSIISYCLYSSIFFNGFVCFFFFFLRKSQAEHHIWGHSQTQPLGELERLSQPIHI